MISKQKEYIHKEETYMNKPYIICYMLQSLDGRIAGNTFSRPESLALSSVYGQKSREFKADAIIYGRTTADEMFCGSEYDR